MTEIGQTIINEIRMVAAADPDFRYDAPIAGGGCVYVFDGKPSCLVGRALWRLGYIDAKFEKKSHNINFDAADDVLAGLDLILDEDEVEWIVRAQERQDNGESWGHSVGIS